MTLEELLAREAIRDTLASYTTAMPITVATIWMNWSASMVSG